MDLLQNELIKKYFGPREDSIVEGCEHEINRVGEHLQKEMALRILTAMQQPIMHSERYLCHQTFEPNWFECVYAGEQIYEAAGFHPFTLRLPDSFQTKECNCTGHSSLDHHQYCQCCNWNKSADPVEEKIKALQFEWASEIGMDSRFIIQLRELVSLARQSGTR